MGPIFNEKVAEKWNLWVCEQCTNALFTVEKSTFAATVQWTVHEQLLHYSWNMLEKKEKERKRTKREAANADAASAQSKRALSQLLGINSWD